MELLVFVLASAMVLAGAIGVIAYNNPVHAALGLVLTLFGIAVHFVSMEAHFLAAVQVIVYAGAIVVLFLFVIMLLDGVPVRDHLVGCAAHGGGIAADPVGDATGRRGRADAGRILKRKKGTT